MYRTGSFLFSIYVFSFLAFSASMGVNAQDSRGAPEWIRDPYKKFDRQTYVAASGAGDSRQAAERDALGKLVAVFGQSIQVDEKISTFYQEAVNSGVAVWSENTSVHNTISTSAGMDSLLGAEIGDRWDNGKDYYAAAILNKTKAAAAYSGLIRANLDMVNNLVNIPESEKYTLDGYARYQFAAVIADMTVSYSNVLIFISAQDSTQRLNPGDDYRLEAQNITKTIPVAIRVKNDRSGRIEGAFARAFSELGFRSGGNNSRYVLEVDVIVSPVEFPKNPNKFARMELNANLTDTANMAVLLPYTYVNNREGHATQAEAENRTYTAAEQKINHEYPNLLREYLARLVPERK